MTLRTGDGKEENSLDQGGELALKK